MSKWRLGTWCALFAVLLFAPGCEDSGGGGSLGDGQDLGDNDRNLYVAVGDSITRGQGASIPYPEVLSTMLGKPVLNKGVDGARASEGLSRINSALSHNPGFVLILYGANDVIRGTSPDKVIESLRGIIQAAKANKTIPVIATVPPPVGPRAVLNNGVVSLNVRIRTLAAEEGVELVDLEDAFVGHDEYFTYDGLHPNNTGHSVIAAEFFDALD